MELQLQGFMVGEMYKLLYKEERGDLLQETTLPTGRWAEMVF
jgi:hypothetical protein